MWNLWSLPKNWSHSIDSFSNIFAKASRAGETPKQKHSILQRSVWSIRDGCRHQFFSVGDAVREKYGVSHSNPLQTHQQPFIVNRDDIVADLARYRKPPVLDTHQTRFLAATDNEITEHVDTREDFAIKPVRRVRIGEPMVAENVLPFITDRGSVFGKAFTDFSIGEVIDTEKMGIDERSQVKCVGHKKCQASIGCGNPLDILKVGVLQLKMPRARFQGDT